MVRVKVLYFAGVRTAIGSAGEEFDLPDRVPTSEILALLSRRHPAVAGLFAVSRLAIDCIFAQGMVDLHDQAEVAVLPPVSGG